MASDLHTAKTEASPSSRDLIRLTVKPKTDIYAAPAHGYVFTAPVIYQKIATKHFKNALATVSFNYSHTYDQGGLLFVFPSPDQPNPNATNSSSQKSAPRWVKAGIEVNQGVPQISVVGRDEWADWSLGALPPGHVDEWQRSARLSIKMERHGNALAVLVHGEDRLESSRLDEWRLVREIQWVFWKRWRIVGLGFMRRGRMQRARLERRSWLSRSKGSR